MTQDHSADGRLVQGDESRVTEVARSTTRRSFVRAAGAAAVTSGLGATATTGGLAQSSETNAVRFAFTNLPPLQQGHYEGWAIFGSEKVSTGTFSRGEEYVFETDRDLSMADKLVVTIEPDDDPSAAPSGVVVLAGAVSGSTVDLSFPVDFDGAAGSYILNTPTDEETPATSGVWFLEPGESGHAASLDLPSLPGGWTYEGWAVHQGTPITTGRFDDPTMADDAAPYSGDAGGPPFPGEDFVWGAPEGLSFPIDLTDGASKVVVSVEPDVDGTDPTGETPFQIKPLLGTIPGDAEAGTSYDLQPTLGTIPDGRATLHADAATARAHSQPLHGVAVDFQNLPELAQGHYEGWAIFGSEKVSTGTFEAGGQEVFTSDRDLSMADKLVVTIEPDDDPSPDPSGVVVLAGEVTGRTAELSFPVDFEGANGSYILNTPTDEATPATSGVWFLEPGADGHSQSLQLPPLPSGWTYEGWAVHQGTPITTGRFDDPGMADDAAPYSGDAGGPPFPGEDFVWGAPEGLSFPIDLTDGSSKVVVSVEPDVDGTDPTGPKPFAIKPLAGAIPADAEPGTSYELANTMPMLPSATATLLPDGNADAETVAVELDRDAIGRNGSTQASLVLSDAPMGLSGFEVAVSVADPSVATIDDYDLNADLSLGSTSLISGGGSYLRIKALDLDDAVMAGASDVELATVELAGADVGSTAIDVDVHWIDADGGAGMVPARGVGDWLDVGAVPPIEGALPTDPDGDGVFEDLNGNGEFDMDDVVTYFQEIDDPAIAENPSYYDANGNGMVDFDDIVTLFQSL